MTRKLFCLSPRCGRPALNRQLCSRCYQAAACWVRRGLTTWGELERRGLSRAAEPRPGASRAALAAVEAARRTPVVVALEAARARALPPPIELPGEE